MREDGSFADIDEPGELVLRGPGMTPGYWEDEEATASAIRDGWIHSGDLGVAEGPDGRIKFLDRMKDLIITGGINISPVEIEGTISDLDGVEEVAVIRADDDKFGETPAAIIVGDVEVDAVVEHCNAQLADIKVPRYVVVRD
jgi:fatty-acyl-CoA synthase